MKIKDQIRQCDEAGKGRKEQDDKRASFAPLPQHSHQRISQTCTHAPGNAYEGRDQYIRPCKTGFYHQDRTTERRCNC